MHDFFEETFIMTHKHPRIIKTVTAIIIICAGMITNVSAQKNEIYDKNIATLQVVAGKDWLSPPVVKLNSYMPDDRININFDDLTHSYRRFTYKIEHCEADWSVSEQVFESDFIEGFYEGNTIDNYDESINTNTHYTHYSLSIPNEKCRLKMSGNYKLTVYDENNDENPVLTACFMVVEPLMNIGLNVTTNTDIDFNRSHQQINMQVNYGGLRITDPISQIKTTVMQNGRYDNAKINAKPQIIMADGLRWEHNKELIFNAGNEYHKYEILDVGHPTMGIDKIEWDGQWYHVYPFACEPRHNYIYDEDANGSFYIRNSDNVENETASEYVMVHYTLKCPQPVQGDVYINGTWTNDLFTPEYKMEYDEINKCYRAVIMQKQGYYSYQFVMIGDDGKTRTMPTEGDYYQTENKYQALIYYRGQGERTDRLVGYRQIQLK